MIYKKNYNKNMKSKINSDLVIGQLIIYKQKFIIIVRTLHFIKKIDCIFVFKFIKILYQIF